MIKKSSFRIVWRLMALALLILVNGRTAWALVGCPGADPTGTIPSGAAIQNCIYQAQGEAGTTLALYAGTYLIDQTLTITNPLTLTTYGASGVCYDGAFNPSPQCARLLAMPGTGLAGPILHVTATANVSIANMVFDGNVGQRAAYGFRYSNVQWDYCTACQMIYSVSINAGAASVTWNAFAPNVGSNLFRNNGDLVYVADGLTMDIQGGGGYIGGNWFIDNTDVDLIFFNGPGIIVEYNYIVHTKPGPQFSGDSGGKSFAALMLAYNTPGTFPNKGDFRGAQIRNNTINCGGLWCDFGIQIGQHPWEPTAPRTIGSSIYNNFIRNANQSINIEGGGVNGSTETIIFVFNNDLPLASNGFVIAFVQPTNYPRPPCVQYGGGHWTSIININPADSMACWGDPNGLGCSAPFPPGLSAWEWHACI